MITTPRRTWKPGAPDPNYVLRRFGVLAWEPLPATPVVKPVIKSSGPLPNTFPTRKGTAKRAVRHVETGAAFESIHAASSALNIPVATIHAAVKLARATRRGRFEYVEAA